MAGFVLGVSILWLMVCPPTEWAYGTGFAGLGLGAAIIYVQDRRSQ